MLSRLVGLEKMKRGRDEEEFPDYPEPFKGLLKFTQEACGRIVRHGYLESDEYEADIRAEYERRIPVIEKEIREDLLKLWRPIIMAEMERELLMDKRKAAAASSAAVTNSIRVSTMVAPPSTARKPLQSILAKK